VHLCEDVQKRDRAEIFLFRESLTKEAKRKRKRGEQFFAFMKNNNDRQTERERRKRFEGGYFLSKKKHVHAKKKAVEKLHLACVSSDTFPHTHTQHIYALKWFFLSTR
jgi:DNA-binding helix-hairpin-helix protein with protein kinase domain